MFGKAIVISAIFTAFLFGKSLAGTFTPMASAATNTIASFLNTSNAKLVYVMIASNESDGGDLYFVDFSETSTVPVPHKITAVINAHVPMISPDGRWVVYSYGTGTSGEAGASESEKCSICICKIAVDAQPVLLIADSAFEPRFMYNPPSGKLTVIFPDHAPPCAWEGKGKTWAIEVDTAGGVAKPGTPTVLFQYGAYTGGISYDNRYICGGGGKGAMLDLQSGKISPDTIADRFPLKAFGSPTYATTRRDPAGQACNVSISSSRLFPSTMMYLDFGTMADDSVNDSINSGAPWDMWQIIFVVNSDAQVVKTYLYPPDPVIPFDSGSDSSLGGINWHHPEWSNHPYYATATLNPTRSLKGPNGKWDTHQYQERIYLLNLKTKKYQEVMHRQERDYMPGMPGFYWPWLWVETPGSFTEDPQWLALTPGHDAIVMKPEFTNKRIGGIVLSRSTVIANQYIKTIYLYTMVGRLIKRITMPEKQNTCYLSPSLFRTTGVYFIGVETVNSSKQTLRMNVIR